MTNKHLAQDYLKRSQTRLATLDVLYELNSWPDVVREAQEIVELCLKGLLRTQNIEVPRIHDVSQLLNDHKKRLPSLIQKHLDKIMEISKDLRRDRELSFYGSEDLTPLEFYQETDAKKAKESANWVVRIVNKSLSIKHK